MKRNLLLLASVCAWMLLMAGTAQADDEKIGQGFVNMATVVGESQAAIENPDVAKKDSVVLLPQPLWKQKLYYGYNFDIYYHNDSRNQTKEKGWSISVEPEIGWKLKERLYLGLRFGGSYQDDYLTYNILDLWEGEEKPAELRVQQGSWNVAPYMRYRLKSVFNNKLGIWLEAHLYAGMEFPRVTDGVALGTDYDGLKHTIIYGVQVSPVITYQFSRKSTFQIFFSILSLGYSGTTYRYVDTDPWTGERSNRNEYTNDVIIFSGKLRNLLSNQFTPGLYGLKFGIQKNF